MPKVSRTYFIFALNHSQVLVLDWGAKSWNNVPYYYAHDCNLQRTLPNGNRMHAMHLAPSSARAAVPTPPSHPSHHQTKKGYTLSSDTLFIMVWSADRALTPSWRLLRWTWKQQLNHNGSVSPGNNPVCAVSSWLYTCILSIHESKESTYIFPCCSFVRAVRFSDWPWSAVKLQFPMVLFLLIPKYLHMEIFFKGRGRAYRL